MRTIVFVLLLAGAVGLIAQRNESAITQQELVQRTQELFDAVAGGNQEPWKKYFADDAMYFDEKGRNMDKTALVKDVTPLPKGYSGSIKIENAQSRIVGDTAILSYDMNENETVFGQQLRARYHATDTWMRRRGAWQIVAGQVLRYYEDPAPGKADPAKLAECAGTYELAPRLTRVVTVDGGELYDQRSGRPRERLVPEAPPIFFRKGVEGRVLFRYGADGKVDALVDRRNNEDIVWKKLDNGMR